MEGHPTLTFLRHLDRGAPVSERDGNLDHLAGAAPVRGSDQQILSLEIPPDDAGIFQLLQALRHLQHDVQLDLRGEWNALALHEVLEVAVRAELGDDCEHGVGAVADVALERGVILELLEGAAGVPVHLRGDGREACVWVRIRVDGAFRYPRLGCDERVFFGK